MKEEKYKDLFHNSPDSTMVIKLTPEGPVIQDCTNKMARLFGCERNQIIGKSPLEFASLKQPNGKFSHEEMKLHAKKAMKGETQIFEWTFEPPGKEEIVVEITANPVDLKDGRHVFANIREILR